MTQLLNDFVSMTSSFTLVARRAFFGRLATIFRFKFRGVSRVPATNAVPAAKVALRAFLRRRLVTIFLLSRIVVGKLAFRVFSGFANLM